MNRYTNWPFRMLGLFIPSIKWFIKFRISNKESLIRRSIKDQIWALRHGFYLETIKVCGITSRNFKDYLSNRSYRELHPINKEYSAIIDNKLYLPFLFKDYPELVPKYYFFIDKGRIVNFNFVESSKSGIIQLCKEKNKLVLKNCISQYGRGFFLLEWKENGFFLNNAPVKKEDLLNLIQSLNNYVITEYIYQHEYAAEINRSSANTIRLLCVWDFEKKEFYIAKAFHQFGLKGSIVDNTGSEHGGILAIIDVDTGKIKNIGYIKSNGKPVELLCPVKHPQTEKPIAGVQIPYWNETIKMVLSVMSNLSFLKYVGIDLLITDNSFKILEINSLTTLSDLQIEKGLLKDARMKSFFNNVMNKA